MLSSMHLAWLWPLASCLLHLGQAILLKENSAPTLEHENSSSLGVEMHSFARLGQLYSRAQAKKAACEEEAVCVDQLSSRLGTQLYVLERAMWEAVEKNFCYVVLPSATTALNDLIKIPGDGVLRLQQGHDLSRPEIERRSCAIRCDSWSRCVRAGQASGTNMSLSELRQTMLEHITDNDLLRCTDDMNPAHKGLNGKPFFENGTLVMHIRSGDTTGDKAQSGSYPQPPCAYWENIFLHGRAPDFPGMDGFKWAVIVTERDQRNPCINYMLRKYEPAWGGKGMPGTITVLSRDVLSDACALILGRSVAISFGTWGPSLVRLNKRLLNLYVPFGEDGVTPEEYGGDLNRKAVHWYRQSSTDEQLSYTQHVYSFPGFKAEWDGFDDWAKQMQDYDSNRMKRRIIRADPHADRPKWAIAAARSNNAAIPSWAMDSSS